jgi:4-carboxymuconolactone decarboxylase
MPSQVKEHPMARIAPIPKERMTAAQRHLHDRVASAGRGAAAGPWAVLLRVPEAGERLAGVVEHLMSETLVPQRLKRLAVLAVARAYRAQYEWAVHEPRARAAGLDAAVIEALRTGARPAFVNAQEALVYDLTRELVYERTLHETLHARAVESLGEAEVVELVALIGFYIGLAVILVAFDVEAPNGALPLAP